jgi:hypothetical protein
VEQADGRWWFKYGPDFKRHAVDRMMAGESVSALAKELGVGRRFFYLWREAGYGSAGAQPPILLRRRMAKERETTDRDDAQAAPGAKARRLAERCREMKERQEAERHAVERRTNPLKKRVAELEQLVGRQAAELDFFAAALRSIEESRPRTGDDSGNECTPQSKPRRKAR